MNATTVIEGGTVLVGRDLTPVPGSVAIEEGRIIEAGRGVAGPMGAERVDATGLLVLSGFIDSHVHVGFFSPVDIVRNGVTTVRDLAWPPEVIFELVKRSRADDFDGPSIIAAGPMLTAPGGYPTRAAWAPPGTGFEVATPEAGRAAVADVARAGACVVKIALNPDVGPVLDESTLTAIVDAAHDWGLKVTGHISGLDELLKALRAGIDELAHMLMSEERIPDDVIRRMVAQDVVVVPTLSCRFGRDGDIATENLARFVRSGGAVVYGTDLGNEGPRPGIDAREVKAMEAAGMTARDVIASATVRSAAWLGLRNAGAIEPGADADLVCVPEAALRSAADLSRVEMVWRRGRKMR